MTYRQRTTYYAAVFLAFNLWGYCGAQTVFDTPTIGTQVQSEPEVTPEKTKSSEPLKLSPGVAFLIALQDLKLALYVKETADKELEQLLSIALKAPKYLKNIAELKNHPLKTQSLLFSEHKKLPKPEKQAVEHSENWLTRHSFGLVKVTPNIPSEPPQKPRKASTIAALLQITNPNSQAHQQWIKDAQHFMNSLQTIEQQTALILAAHSSVEGGHSDD